MADSIGSESFVRLSPTLTTAKRLLADITRPATTGRAYRYFGTHGENVEVFGERDVADIPAAIAKKADYAAMIGSTYVVVQQGTTLSGYWLVVDVDVVDIRPLVKSVGGIGSGNAWVVSRWVLCYHRD